MKLREIHVEFLWNYEMETLYLGHLNISKPNKLQCKTTKKLKKLKESRGLHAQIPKHEDQPLIRTIKPCNGNTM
jgi:hypothetical protein